MRCLVSDGIIKQIVRLLHKFPYIIDQMILEFENPSLKHIDVIDDELFKNEENNYYNIQYNFDHVDLFRNRGIE